MLSQIKKLKERNVVHFLTFNLHSIVWLRNSYMSMLGVLTQFEPSKNRTSLSRTDYIHITETSLCKSDARFAPKI